MHVLAAGGEHGIVQCPIPGGGAHPGAIEIFGHHRRQDPDHHDMRAALTGSQLGGVEAGPHVLLKFEGCRTRQGAGRHIHLDVVGAQLRLKGGVGDRGEHLGVRHRGLIIAVYEVELDFQAGQRPLEVKPGLGEHRLEHVQTVLHLGAVGPAVLTGELGARHFVAHGHILPQPAACTRWFARTRPRGFAEKG